MNHQTNDLTLPSIIAEMLGEGTRGTLWSLRVGLSVLAWPLGAQERVATERPRSIHCDGLSVREVVVEPSTRPPIDGDVPSLARPALRFAMQGRTTRAEAVRPFLLFRVGDRCDLRRIRETERVLRAQPFLADAAVRVEADGAGGVRLVVTTVDEIPLLVGGSLAAGGVSGLRYGSTNLGGNGTRALGEWSQGFAYRDGLRTELVLAHTMGRPHRLTVIGERTQLDQHVRVAWERPFWTTFQRTGWFVGTDVVDGHVRLVREGDLPLALPYRARRVDVGGVARVGGERLGLFAGPFVTHERRETFGMPRRVGDAGFEDDPDPVVAGRYGDFESSRASAVIGGRWLSFARAEGLDALEGPQDIGRGAQLALLGGVGLGGNAGSRYLGADLFVGAGTPTSYIALRGSWEERHGSDRTTDGLVSARLRWFLRTSPRGLWVLGGELAGAWDERRPFQFLLGDRDVGVRGFLNAHAVGAQRAVVRAEYRRLVGGIGRHASFAWSGFGDVGGVRAGDAPFGVTTDPQASVGAALLVAVPRQSRQLWRVEAAAPLGAQAPGSLVWRVGMSSPWREFWRDPRDVAAMRAVIPPASLFGFP